MSSIPAMIRLSDRDSIGIIRLSAANDVRASQQPRIVHRPGPERKRGPELAHLRILITWGIHNRSDGALVCGVTCRGS